ncbi:MAG: TlpA disulfide reductase family protein [Bacteroidales bacterium]|nr:TlpA disulfide reductase family protein [Bacteroidales bacterium]
MYHFFQKHISLFAASVMLAACSTSPKGNPEGVVLNLDIAGLPENTQLQISLGSTQQPEEAIQTVTLVGGKAQFSFPADGPRIYEVGVPNTYGYMQVVLDKGNVATLSATAADNTREDQNKTMFEYSNQQVTGTSLQDEYLRRRVDREVFNQRYDAMWKIADKDSFEVAQKQFFTDVENTYKACFKANADSWWGPMFILNTYTYISSQNEADYNLLSEEAKQSFYGKILHDKIWPPSVVGADVPDFTFTNHADGRQTSLYQCLEGKKYLLIDFWASWCKPCRREIPNIMEQYKKYADKGFEVVSISADTNQKAWLKALDDEKLPWYNDIDGAQGIANKYKVTYYPTIYLIDANHKVVAKDIKGEELAAKLAELFK